MSRIVIGIVGELGSGKGETAHYLCTQYGAATYRFSTILRDLTERLSLEPNRTNLQNISTVLRKEFGDDILSRAMLSDISKDTAPIIVIEGVRRPTDTSLFRSTFPTYLVAISAKPEIRYKRIIERNENEGDNKKTFADFEKDGTMEAELRIKELIQTADFTIQNNGTIQELHSQIDVIMQQLCAST